jgi:hypothetical protein
VLSRRHGLVVIAVVFAVGVIGATKVVIDRLGGIRFAEPAASASAVAAIRAAASAEAAPRPALCDAPRPVAVDPFPYNRAWTERDTIVSVKDPSEYRRGGVAQFEALDRTRLAVLLERRFINPDDRQNASPTMWEMFRFICDHPRVLAHGYVVEATREDYRTSIDTLYSPTIDGRLRTDARRFCTDTDGLELGSSLECWWD